MVEGRARLRVGACLSLSGRYARFGTQAAGALRLWAASREFVDLTIEDDESARGTLATVLPVVAARSDVLVGPYSTHLARSAARISAQEGWLLWNQGGSGDDVETDYPGHCVSILTPTSRYGEPFVHQVVGELWIVRAAGSFGLLVGDGMRTFATDLGVAVRVVTAEEFAALRPAGSWCLFSVGSFEDDVAIVRRARDLANPPSAICAVAAGVREFGDLVDDPDGVFGIAQWFPGMGSRALLGPSEGEFLRDYRALTGDIPDYPAIQAVAGAVVAEHCVIRAGSTEREALWDAASTLDTTTLFGDFRIDPVTGAQRKHATALLRWRGGELRSDLTGAD